jgi:hypothetical protein
MMLNAMHVLFIICDQLERFQGRFARPLLLSGPPKHQASSTAAHKVAPMQSRLDNYCMHVRAANATVACHAMLSMVSTADLVQGL